MKQSVQILLFIALLVPLLAGAREETMEERKQRITRKYLRERAEITYSEMAVPDVEAENTEVLASEIYKQPQVDLQRQEGGIAMPRPPVRRPTPRVENSNWLLAESPEIEDPYADPFAVNDASSESAKKSDWTSWGRDRSSSTYNDQQAESRFNRRTDYESASQSFFNPRDPRSSTTERFSSGFQQEGSSFLNRSQYGQQQESSLFYSSERLDLSREKTSKTTFTRNRLQSPYQQEAQSRSGQSIFSSGTPFQSEGYTPYKSSFQIQQEQRKQEWGESSMVQPEFQKLNTYQQWKEKKPVKYDPTSDDAFIQEMMPKTRR